MSEREWMVRQGGQEHGPYSGAELEGYIRDGHITGEALVWSEGMGSWAPASRFGPSTSPPAIGGSTGRAVKPGRYANVPNLAGTLRVCGSVFNIAGAITVIGALLAAIAIFAQNPTFAILYAVVGVMSGLITMGLGAAVRMLGEIGCMVRDIAINQQPH